MAAFQKNAGVREKSLGQSTFIESIDSLLGESLAKTTKKEVQSHYETHAHRKLVGLQYAGTNDGTRRFRCSLNSSIVPGDIARMVERNDEELTVDLISITVNKSSSLMEISEA